MSLFDNLKVAIGGISSNKLRSVLTTLGVLIGVAAVIILVAVGTGSSQAVESQINQLGTNMDALIQKLESIRMHLGDRELEREFLAAHRLRDKLREMS